MVGINWSEWGYNNPRSMMREPEEYGEARRTVGRGNLGR